MGVAWAAAVVSAVWSRRLAERAAALGPDLVSAACDLAGGPTALAARLAADTGRAYTANLVCRWRRSEAPVPEPARAVMSALVLDALVGPAAPAVARVLSPPTAAARAAAATPPP